MKDLQRISVIGMGLLGGSVSLAIRQRMPGTVVVGYSHRAATRSRARSSALATEVADDLKAAVTQADLVILATPIFTFEHYFAEISATIPSGCIVTDVGSTKVLPHRWAEQSLGKQAHYVGSHPIAGSEQRGLEFARDDLLAQARCILTTTPQTHRASAATLRQFWSDLGCYVQTMTPEDHDRVFANISHLPHLIAAGLVNASDWQDVKYAGKGFLDSTRIASGPANIWTDVLLANGDNIADGIERVLAELTKLRKAVQDRDRKEIEALLEAARRKRASLVKYKIRKKELLS
ncbi:MAG: prephenate dehydrogenase [Sedimentisphaerales bacterium]|nr:prephenate dehydrogenase [Sedimentisphaerales bacterium]